MHEYAPDRGSPSTENVPRDAAHLTARERQVLARIADGHTSKQIAELLGIGLRTVNCHRENLAKKLGTSSVAALTRFALQHGIADTD